MYQMHSVFKPRVAEAPVFLSWRSLLMTLIPEKVLCRVPFAPFRRFLAAVLPLSIMFFSVGCGNIADKDRIRIAKIDNTYVTRADLFKYLREMPDTERPQINSKTDLLRVLRRYLDERIKIPLGHQLALEGKVKISREEAREQFFKNSGDEEQLLRNIWSMEVPPEGQTTPLMQTYGLTAASLRARKEFIEQETDKTLEQMQADAALSYLAAQAARAGEIHIDEDALKREYEMNKARLKKFEWIRFRGLRFPAQASEAAQMAAEVRERLDAGADFDMLVEEYKAIDPRIVFESEIENNPELLRFQNFWLQTSGAKPGDIIGPLYLPSYTQMTVDARGKTQAVQMPDAYVIFKVLEAKPEREMTFEEVRPLFEPQLYINEMMKKLWRDHGVEIYEENLPDPRTFGEALKDPLLGI